MNQSLELLEAGKAAERALAIVTRGLQMEGELPLTDSHRLVDAALRLNCAALEIQRLALKVPKPPPGD